MNFYLNFFSSLKIVTIKLPTSSMRRINNKEKKIQFSIYGLLMLKLTIRMIFK